MDEVRVRTGKRLGEGEEVVGDVKRKDERWVSVRGGRARVKGGISIRIEVFVAVSFFHLSLGGCKRAVRCWDVWYSAYLSVARLKREMCCLGHLW